MSETRERTISDDLIEKHRNINVTHQNWWESVENEIKEEQEALGVYVRHVYFRGFWSQGDGACFVGEIDNPKVFMEKHGLGPKFPWVSRLLEKGGTFRVEMTQSGRYVHSHSVSYSCSIDTFLTLLDPQEPLMESIATVWDAELDKEIPALEEAVGDIMRSAMDDAYRRLEQDHDYLTSDEQVRETLEACGIYDDEEDEEL